LAPNTPGDLPSQDDATDFAPAKREFQADWAWQHVVGDVDKYVITFPGVTQVPSDHTACRFDQAPLLTIHAPGMHLHSDELGEDQNELIRLDALQSRFPSGGTITVLVTPRSDGRPRGLYRLTAHWRDGLYVTPEKCAELEEALAGFHDRFFASFPRLEQEIQKGIVALSGKDPLARPGGPDPSPFQVGRLGGYTAFPVEPGEVLDVNVF